ncbi:lysozyme inhibitor LprI family protein [Herminiimonas glaciei]|uniref:Lysozyme inhibitor LprI family protein n=1 Tax=Herminiimonas glaciei TaxID=523788 RepID=A0ABW2I973_9BURK
MNKITLAFLTLLPVAAFAQQVDPCLAKGTPQEMNACAKEADQKAQEKLDTVYKALLKQIPAQDQEGIPYVATKKQLRIAQKEWSKFVEQDCKTVSIYNKGSILKDIEYFSCTRLHAEQRTSDLERFLSRRSKAKS